MGKPLKSDGTYNNTTTPGRMSKGKTVKPKGTEKSMSKGLKNTGKSGKKG